MNDSMACKYLCIGRGGNAQLGNRCTNRYGLCPSCLSRRLNLKLGEAHVLFGCPALANERAALNISAYKALSLKQGLLSYPEFVASYLGRDGAACTALLKCARKMGVLLECWLTSDCEP